jgi:hypothetical protein
MTNGCIKKVLGVIKENSYQLGFISISADIYGKNWMLKDKNPLGLMDDIRFNNVGMLFSTLKDHIGLTPTIIVRRNLWVRYVNIRKLTDDYWFHVRMVLAIAEENDTYFIAAPPVMFNQSQVRWNRNGLFLQIVIDYCEMVLQLSDSKIGFRNKMEAIDRWYQSFWIHILVAKRNDWRLDISQVVRLIRVFKRFPRFWFFDLPLLFVPRVVVKFLFSIREKMLNISIRDA